MTSNEEIIEINTDGESVRKIQSDLGDEYEIIDKVKDLTELSQKEYDALMYQDRIRTCDDIKNKIKEATVWYGWANSAIKVIKTFI